MAKIQTVDNMKNQWECEINTTYITGRNVT